MAKKYAPRADLKTRIEIASTLEGVLSRREDSDLWKYAPGWSDVRVAIDVSRRLELDEDIKAVQVRRVRVELFGHVQREVKLQTSGKPASDDVDIVEKLNRIETKLDKLVSLWIGGN